MEVMHFTVVHLAGTYILKHTVKIPWKLMSQTCNTSACNSDTVRIVYFKSYSDCCTLALWII